MIAETDVTGGLRRAYTYGPGIDNLLAMTVYTGAVIQTYYYLTDLQGTVHAVANSAGAIVEHYRFDAWGRILGVFDANDHLLPVSAIGNRFLFQGREYSWSSGLYYFRARWYDPVTGRWLSKDPIGIAGGLNQYVFCANNPVNFVDPDGLFAKEGHEYWMDIAVAGQNRGGIGGNLQTAGASLMTAFIDFWGARSIQGNAEKSGYYSGEGCTGKAVGHGLLAGGQIALAATSAFGGNNVVHPYYRYVGAGSRPLGKGAWLVRGTIGRGAPYGRNFAQAANKLQIPPQSMIDDVIRVPGAWKKFIGGPRRVRGNPQWGVGGGTEYRMGMWLWP